MSPVSQRSVAFKLSLAALVSLLLVLLTTMTLVSLFIWRDFGAVSRHDAHQYATQMRTLVQSFDETAQEQAKRDFVLFKSRFSGDFSVQEQPGADGKPEAVLNFQGMPLNGNFEGVDRFTKDSAGAIATIFARTGDDFIRVTTSLKKQDGERAYKTLLDRNHPAYSLMQEGKTYIGRASLFGKEYMTVYEPIREGNRTIGILFIGTDMGAILGKLAQVMGSQKLFETGAVYAVNVSTGPARGRTSGLASALVVDEKTEEGKAWLAKLTEKDQTGELEVAWSPRLGAGAQQRQFVATERYKPWNWVIVAEAPLSEMMKNARAVLIWLWVGVLAALVILTVVLVYATRRLVGKPVQQLSAALGFLSQGDLTRPVDIRSNDEIGALGQAMEGFRQRLAQSLGTVRRSAESVSSASYEIAQGNQDLSARTETQASSLEETAASMEELGSTIRHNADNASQASRLAASASQVAAQGGDVVAQVVSTMHNINGSSQKIADIIGVIDGIAFQTNILALNAAVEAAVEAARAGEQGRGFAVVASEVRNLAQRTATEAKAIKELIGASSAMVQEGSVLADKAGTTMGEVVSAIQRVADIVSEISAATGEQSAGVGQVGQAVTQLDQATQQNAALVEEMAAAASSLRTQAEQMVEAVAQFKLGQEPGQALQLGR